MSSTFASITTNDCAHSVVELITKYWPAAIDPLPQERGMSPGEKPIFFSDPDAAQLQQSLFRDGYVLHGGHLTTASLKVAQFRRRHD